MRAAKILLAAAAAAVLAASPAAAKPGPPGFKANGEIQPTGNLTWCLDMPVLRTGTLITVQRCARGNRSKQLWTLIRFESFLRIQLQQHPEWCLYWKDQNANAIAAKCADVDKKGFPLRIAAIRGKPAFVAPGKNHGLLSVPKALDHVHVNYPAVWLPKNDSHIQTWSIPRWSKIP